MHHNMSFTQRIKNNHKLILAFSAFFTVARIFLYPNISCREQIDQSDSRVFAAWDSKGCECARKIFGDFRKRRLVKSAFSNKTPNPNIRFVDTLENLVGRSRVRIRLVVINEKKKMNSWSCFLNGRRIPVS